MALMLAAATAATAATAFAGTNSKLQGVEKEVVSTIRLTADKAQYSKVKTIGSRGLQRIDVNVPQLPRR
ncbi:MAG: hypothetical protein KDK75_23230, partial [Alphaproteobacteria bacterium]|nr:hypothetical protein [Alphaproteobacteria bacterium]